MARLGRRVYAAKKEFFQMVAEMLASIGKTRGNKNKCCQGFDRKLFQGSRREGEGWLNQKSGGNCFGADQEINTRLIMESWFSRGTGKNFGFNSALGTFSYNFSI